MFINIIRSYRDVVAICDSDLLGKHFEQEVKGVIRQLDVKESFYKGEDVSEEKIIEIIRKMEKEDATFNIVGKKSVAIAIKTGIITEESVGKIKDIPFALILL